MSGFMEWLFGTNRQIYRTHIASNDFEFEFVPQHDGTVRVYIDRQPAYAHRSDDLQSTHRYHDGRRYYVCIRDDLAPRNFTEARGWADYFASRTTNYIRTGQRFS
jgi:hypothetical protein